MTELKQRHHRDHHDRRVVQWINILRDQHFNLRPDAVVMDFGCANGHMVAALKAAGFYRATGCDVAFDSDASLNKDVDIRLIASPRWEGDYTLPYADKSIDVILSDQVLEHVRNVPAVLGELNRVLRTRGVMVHMFPSRGSLIEPHVFVPLGTVFRATWWLKLWAFLGVRSAEQRSRRDSWREVARRNSEWLDANTNYFSKAAYERHFGQHFGGITVWIEQVYLRYAGRARWLLKIPGGALLYRRFYQRVSYTMKGRDCSSGRWV